jgi:hypothetical protein
MGGPGRNVCFEDTVSSAAYLSTTNSGKDFDSLKRVEYRASVGN